MTRSDKNQYSTLTKIIDHPKYDVDTKYLRVLGNQEIEDPRIYNLNWGWKFRKWFSVVTCSANVEKKHFTSRLSIGLNPIGSLANVWYKMKRDKKKNKQTKLWCYQMTENGKNGRVLHTVCLGWVVFCFVSSSDCTCRQFSIF